MITMNPVLLHGRSVWDQDYFPPDERDERLRLVRAEMARDGLGCLVVFGHCTDYGDLCYLTQYIPMVGWSMVVLPAEGDPVLVLGLGGGRDIPSARARTWVADVRGLPNLSGGLTQLLTELGTTGLIGLIGADRSLPARLYDEAVGSIGEDRCVVSDDLLVGMRRSLRPREISAVRQAAGIVQEAAAAFADSVANGSSNAAAMVEAEGTARRLGALDFRGLVNLSKSGRLEPVTELDQFRTDTVAAYLAASFLGYWADLAITVDTTASQVLQDAREALQAMVERVQAGTKAGELARLATDKLGEEYRDGAGRLGFGHALGLSSQGSPFIVGGSQESLTEDSIVSLRVRTDGLTNPGVVVSDLVLVRANGCESLIDRASHLGL